MIVADVIGDIASVSAANTGALGTFAFTPERLLFPEVPKARWSLKGEV
jgi:hypothetical protein